MDERPSPAYIVNPSLHPAADACVSYTEYESTFPTSFGIGTGRTPPLVDSAQLRGHLALLRSFVILRSQLDHMDAGFPLLEDKDRRWAWFVSVAVERFTIWCQSLTHADITISTEQVLPPLDVLMVWHAYMLNPGWYAEDSSRLPGLDILKEVGRTFATSLPDLPGILDRAPVDARIQGWNAKTQREFDPLGDAALWISKTILCPTCRNPIVAAFMTSEGTGYFQENFMLNCTYPHCKAPPITKITLAVRKLAEDLVRDDMTPRSYLAGTLHTANYNLDVGRGKYVKDIVMKAPEFKRINHVTEEDWLVSIMEKNKYKLNRVRSAMSKKINQGGGNVENLIRRVMNAYTDDRIYSIDLLGAVIRQGSFVHKMHALHWTELDFFTSREGKIALQHAIARYHAFLDLMSTSPRSFLVPTLDIDLVWHTHQLMAHKYDSDCRSFVGRFIDHDDKVEEASLATAFDLTCRAWKSRYNVRYAHCGCPMPGENFREKLARIGKAKPSTSTPSHLIPPKQDELLAATHPSDHNAVFAFHQKWSSETSQQRRRKKFAKRQRANAKLADAGQLDRGDIDRPPGHDPAFLVPVPLYFHDTAGPGCVAAAGNIVNSAGNGAVGGCAVGAGGCSPGGSACGTSGGCGGGAGHSAGFGGWSCGATGSWGRLICASVCPSDAVM